ncbi:MAG TPA: pyrimidine/purine nucleoside phosphorylase [Methylococcaceae bacterium]|jgi:uncharacterized protein YaiE (UPF0345 family)|nr:pyrimidine/purine nucleoside phosphorylase [Methylococcaceae bacterium]
MSHFPTAAPGIVEILGGVYTVELSGESEWKRYQAEDCFNVPGNSRAGIKTLELLNYVCDYG